MGKSKDLATGETRFVNTSGDTMTGALTVGGAVTVNPDADSSLLIKDGGTNALFMAAATGDELYIGANNEYAIRIKNDGTKDVAFDNGSRVTIPSQPGWHGTHSDNYGSAYSDGTAHDMDSSLERYNVGNHFNYTNNRFTCPIAGYYLVYGWDICLNSSSIYNTGNAIGCWKNTFSSANRLVSAYRMYGRGYSFTGTAYLAANDYVTFGNSESSIGAGAYYGSLSYSGYGIRLIA